jgi:predicted PurR-regulated permease PerM
MSEINGLSPNGTSNEKGFELAAMALFAMGLVITLSFGLLPMMFGLLGARAASLALAHSRLLSGRGHVAKLVASLSVGAVAAAILAGVSVWMFDSGVKAVKEAPQLAVKITEKARELKTKLPPGIGDRIPDEDQEIQAAIADAIGKQMPSIAGVGKAWAAGALFALIGWIIGLVMANIKPADPASGPLARQLRERGKRFSDLFKEIVVAQFFVSCANTLFAAIYMFGILPMAGIEMPWAGALVAMTLVVSMIPVAGNVLCNGVVTLVALSVGPGVALASLTYLIVVHKIEYFINAKVVGKRVSASVWELLLAMFALEAMFGVGGLVAAPLFYAYVKSELKSLGWV